MLAAPKQYFIFNLPVHLLENYTSWLMERLQRGSSTHVVTLNAEMVMLSEKKAELGEIVERAELVIPDGAGIILYLRMHGYKQRRCPGIELAESLLLEIGKSSRPYSVCFYGGAPGVARKAAEIWQQKVPGLSIIVNHGYLSPEEGEAWQEELKTLQPNLILVGLGVPRQEFWIDRNRSFCPNAIWIGVGGSFDIWSQTKTRAPLWLRENNLEWLYRLYQEPWRWRRMLVLPQFLIRAFFAKKVP